MLTFRFELSSWMELADCALLLLCDVFDKEAKGCWLTRVSSLAAHFVLSRCARVFMDIVRSFTDRSCFWDLIDFTSMTVLFSNMLV